jgi:hypothetical protein
MEPEGLEIEVFVALFLGVQFFWDMMLCKWAGIAQLV